MKVAIKNILILVAIILLWKLFFIPPKNLYNPSKDIKESKRVKAYVGECHIFKVDTLALGYKFPIDKVWAEKLWSLGRNRIGIVVPVTENNIKLRFNINSEDSFFKKYNFISTWIIKDSLAGEVGLSKSLATQKCFYNGGDTAIFKIFKLNSDSSILYQKERDMELIFKIYAVCNW